MATVKLSYDGIGEMLSSPAMQREMKRRADKIKDAAEAASPVGGAGDPHPGRYKASFSSSSGIRPKGAGRTRRAVGQVVNDSPEVYYVEYGTKTTPRHRTLGTAMDAARD